LSAVSAETSNPSIQADQSRAIARDALGIAVATGAYALSFGALSVAAGLSLGQTCALSLLMFTGASQFALIGVLGGGGSAASGVATASLLGARNAFYGLRLTDLLGVRGLRKLAATHFVIDETTAMAVVRTERRAARLAFWTTGLILFACWNAGTLLGALGGAALSDPTVLGLDAAAPAAFLALLAPQVRAREPLAVALAAAAVAVALTPVVPAGVPVLGAGALAIAVVLLRPTPAPERAAAGHGDDSVPAAPAPPGGEGVGLPEAVD
jgi:predicted branched-subunit amino acid permease